MFEPPVIFELQFHPSPLGGSILNGAPHPGDDIICSGGDWRRQLQTCCCEGDGYKLKADRAERYATFLSECSEKPKKRHRCDSGFFIHSSSSSSSQMSSDSGGRLQPQAVVGGRRRAQGYLRSNHYTVLSPPVSLRRCHFPSFHCRPSLVQSSSSPSPGCHLLWRPHL